MIKISPLILSLCIFIFTSCSSSEPKSGKTEAEVLYKQAKEYMANERYLLAQEKLNAIRSQHPYSYYATHAELMQADILFLQENFAESAAAYLSFRDLHPKHEKMAYVIWRIAESFYRQLPSTFDRDLTASVEALKYYRELIQLFPQSEFISEAQNRTKDIDEMMKKKELYVADFYYRTEAFSSARNRYLNILSIPERFGDEQTRNMAMERIIVASNKMSDKKECTKYIHEFESSYGLIHPSKFAKLREECQEIKE